jgi:hypothetical protein
MTPWSKAFLFLTAANVAVSFVCKAVTDTHSVPNLVVALLTIVVS